MSPSRLPDGLKPGGRFEAWEPGPRSYVLADIDGTLVGPDGGPSPAVTEAVADATARGLRVGIATGRMRQAALGVIAHLDVAGPHILHNGAEVRGGDGEGTLAGWPLAEPQLQAVLEICRELEVYAEIYVDDTYVVNVWDERARPHWQMLGGEPRGVVDSVEELRGTVFKATFAIFDGRDLAPLVAALTERDLAPGPAVAPSTPGIDYVNATQRGVDKGRALRHAAEHVGVELSATTTIGDAANDLSMLRLAGTAVAMADAPQELKDAAHLIAPPVEEDGVVDVLVAQQL